jgi:putative NADH-flavin reductase
MNRISLFGASGKTGIRVLKQALAAGHAVKALVRTPAKLGFSHPSLEVVQGDVLDAAAVRRCVAGCDLVVSLFGQVKGSPHDLQTRGTALILDAMKESDLRRIISLSGGGLPFREDRPQFADRLIRGIMRIAVPHVLDDAIAHAKLLEASGLDWTVVRGPRLTEEARRGHYRVGWVGVNASTQIGRDDLADFILTEIERPAYVRQMPFVSY